MDKCYLCNGDASTLHVGVRDNNDIDVLQCTKCGLVFLSSFEHINNELYCDDQMRKSSVELNITTSEKRDDLRRYEFMKEKISGKKLLDFGCGAGGFLLKAKNEAKLAHGVELNKTLCDSINKTNIKNIKCFSSISDTKDKYDIITLFHVLEHLKDPIASLNEISSKVDIMSGGGIIIEVPSSDDALLKLYRCPEFADFTFWSYHLFLFNPKTLSMLFGSLEKKVNIEYIKQVQRYPLSNHLYWLARGKPGGHQKWHFLGNDMIGSQYEYALASIGACDTIIAQISFGRE